MLNNLGILARREGDLDAAQARFLGCLALYRQAGDTQRVATVLHNLGLTAQDRGDLEEAMGWFEESLALQRALGNARGAAITLNGLGMTTRKRGRPAEAQAFLAESLMIFTQMQDSGGILHNLRSLAEAWLALGLPEPAAVAGGALSAMYQAGEITPLAGEGKPKWAWNKRSSPPSAPPTSLPPTRAARRCRRCRPLNTPCPSAARRPPESPCSLILKFSQLFTPAARNQGGGRFLVTMLSR